MEIRRIGFPRHRTKLEETHDSATSHLRELPEVVAIAPLAHTSRAFSTSIVRIRWMRRRHPRPTEVRHQGGGNRDRDTPSRRRGGRRRRRRRRCRRRRRHCGIASIILHIASPGANNCGCHRMIPVALRRGGGGSSYAKRRPTRGEPAFVSVSHITFDVFFYTLSECIVYSGYCI